MILSTCLICRLLTQDENQSGWFSGIIEPEDVIVLVVYNGETYDLKWLCKLTQAPRSPYDLPATMVYYMDSLKAIKEYVGCKLNPKHSKLDSLELGVVWKYINSGANTLITTTHQ